MEIDIIKRTWLSDGQVPTLTTIKWKITTAHDSSSSVNRVAWVTSTSSTAGDLTPQNPRIQRAMNFSASGTFIEQFASWRECKTADECSRAKLRYECRTESAVRVTIANLSKGDCASWKHSVRLAGFARLWYQNPIWMWFHKTFLLGANSDSVTYAVGGGSVRTHDQLTAPPHSATMNKADHIRKLFRSGKRIRS